MAKSLFQFFEDVNTEKMVSDIEIKQFNVEYYALDPNTTSDIITAKDEVSNTGKYHLRNFLHDLSKTLSIKQNGEVTVTFAMNDLYRNKQYLIEIKYTHNREKGIGVFVFKANNRESRTNINSVKINPSIITSNEKALFSKLQSEAPENYPAAVWMKLLYTIYYALKAVLKTQNYRVPINKNEQRQ